MTCVPVPSQPLAALALDPAEELSLDWVAEAPLAAPAAAPGTAWRVLFTALALLASGLAAGADAPPAPPYYSVEIATAATEAAAREALKPYAGLQFARAEKRKSGYIVRIGASKSRAEAERLQKSLQERGARRTRILQIEHPAPWIVPSAAVAAAPPPVVVKPPVVAPHPAAAPKHAAAPVAKPAGDLTELSLVELMDVKVTSVSKHAEPLKHAAAAIFVLSGEDIRRSGVRTIAAALRMVPGLQVYRTNAQSYNVTARGFGSDKLEVLIDGRSAYTPLTSTVFWDQLDTYLPDIDRIEVIRGPGAALWGANAVNGVINIVTKAAANTLGTEVQGGGGKEERDFAAARSGGKIGDSGYARIYAKAFERDHTVQRTGADSIDGQRQGSAGFRSDWMLDTDQDLSVTGDYVRGNELGANIVGGGRAPDSTLTAANLVGRWTWHEGPSSEVSVQAYYDGYRREVPQVFADQLDTGDLQVQHRFNLFASNTFVYGAGYRGSRDRTGGPPLVIVFSPGSRTLQTYSAFFQDQQRLGDVEITVGSKFEHNTYTGFEVQPGIRLGWQLGSDWFTWAAVSRAVRLPNRIDEDIAIFCPPPVGFPGICGPNTTLLIGNPNFESEKVIAYEWGLRFSGLKDLFVDLSAFYNHYTKLRSTETTPPPFGSFGNELNGDSYGGELALAWTPLPWVEVRPFYNLLEIDIHRASSTDAFTAKNLEGGSPQQSAGLRLGVTPHPRVTLDGFLRYVDSLPRQQVHAYTELDLRAAWRIVPGLEVALVGANLIDPRHPEAGTAPSATTPFPPQPATEIERAGWLELTWRWQ